MDSSALRIDIGSYLSDTDSHVAYYCISSAITKRHQIISKHTESHLSNEIL